MKTAKIKWTASSEFGTYRLCEQRRFRRACASAQSRQNLRCSLIQAVNQEELSDRKPNPWPLWMAGHAQLKFVMTECSKTQIRLTRLKCQLIKIYSTWQKWILALTHTGYFHWHFCGWRSLRMSRSRWHKSFHCHSAVVEHVLRPWPYTWSCLSSERIHGIIQLYR